MPSGSKPTGEPILIDDVLTTGAHILAARMMLKSRGIIAEHGIVCGRSDDVRLVDPFVVGEEDVQARAFFGMATT